MAGRALRRHHAERVVERFRQVARRWNEVGSFCNRWEWRREPDGSLVGRSVVYLDGAAERERVVERQARRRASHPACACGLCRNSPRSSCGPYDRREARREEARLLREHSE